MTTVKLPFTDEFGEFHLVINRDAETGTIYFLGTDKVGGTIKDNILQPGLIINREEFWWLAVCWLKSIGRELKLPTRKMIQSHIAELVKEPQRRMQMEAWLANVGAFFWPGHVLRVDDPQRLGSSYEDVVDFLTEKGRHDVAVLLVPEDGPATTNGQAL